MSDGLRPLVSVILPVYNNERWLSASLGSVFNQDMGDYEVIVIDDGSTDRSVSRVRGFQDSRLRLLQRPHGGTIAALNSGLANARGKYVARMDADDVSLPSRLREQVAAAESDGAVIVVGCGFDLIDTSGRECGRVIPPVVDAHLRRRLLVRNPFAGGSILIRFDGRVTYNEQSRRAEDYELIWRLSQRGLLTSVPKRLYKWRRHEANSSDIHRRQRDSASARIKQQVWDRGIPSPLSRSALNDALTDYLQIGGEDGSMVAAQFVETEILIAAALASRGHLRAATRHMAGLALSLPRAWRPLVMDFPGRFPRVLRSFFRLT